MLLDAILPLFLLSALALTLSVLFYLLKPRPSKIKPHCTTLQKILHLRSLHNSPTFSTTFLGKKLFHITSYDSALKLLSDKAAGTDKGFNYMHFSPLFGKSSIFTLSLPLWSSNRKQINKHVFSKTCTLPLDDLIASALKNRLSNLPLHTPLKILPILQKVTLEIIYQYTTANSLYSVHSLSSVESYILALMSLRVTLLKTSKDWRYYVMPSFLYRFTCLGSEVYSASLTVRSFIEKAFEFAKPDSIINSLTATSKEYRIDQLSTLLFAGTDTSAASTSWWMLLFPEDSCDLAHQIKEAGRLKPVAPMIVRYVDKAIECDGVEVKGSVVIWLNAISLSTDSEVQFGIGKRSCPGREVGNKIVRGLAGWLRERYEWKVRNIEEEDGEDGFTYVPGRGGEIIISSNRAHKLG
ncbi:hypothetical protein TL16_g00019 [Triparma laevis f. inornata]|uniref:Cytochrome P450 n=2 Tax=Triparma laevis TaxID=1534972 RepID=A0A9W7CL84_9STRA|nr:hypothetical protein TL16_g00019 [Triparma laevis f. inornata]GMI07873.1 hypothetical protein TrLO_g11599 [Triparma laevis f. longispina]